MTPAETINAALDKANMMLCGYGANNTAFLLDAKKALAEMEETVRQANEDLHLVYMKGVSDGKRGE